LFDEFYRFVMMKKSINPSSYAFRLVQQIKT
jgi:hypothetical protein